MSESTRALQVGAGISTSTHLRASANAQSHLHCLDAEREVGHCKGIEKERPPGRLLLGVRPYLSLFRVSTPLA